MQENCLKTTGNNHLSVKRIENNLSCLEKITKSHHNYYSRPRKRSSKIVNRHRKRSLNTLLVTELYQCFVTVKTRMSIKIKGHNMETRKMRTKIMRYMLQIKINKQKLFQKQIRVIPKMVFRIILMKK